MRLPNCIIITVQTDIIKCDAFVGHRVRTTDWPDPVILISFRDCLSPAGTATLYNIYYTCV